MPGRRRHREQFQALPVRQQLQLVRLVEALDFFVPVPRQSDLDVVLAVAREGISKQGAATRPQRKSLHMLLLREVRPNSDGITARRAVGRADRQPADLLRGGDVPLQERRGEISDRHVVKAVTQVVLGQQRRGIDFQCQ